MPGENYFALNRPAKSLASMATMTFKVFCSLAVVCLLGGCGDGLTHALGVDNDDGGAARSDGPLYATIASPSLGNYAQPCGVLGNAQPMLSSFAPTGDVVALAVGPGHVELLATSDGHTVGGFDAHLGMVATMAFSPKENLLATAGVDGAVKLWRDGGLVAERQVFSRAVAGLVWSHGGSSLAALTGEGPIAMLDVRDNDLTLRWRDARVHQGVIFAPDDTVVVASYPADPATSLLAGSRTFRVSDGSELESGLYFSVHAQSPDGSLIALSSTLASSSVTTTFARLALQDEAVVVTVLWERGVQTTAPRIAFTADSRQVAIWGYGDTKPAKLYEVENGNLVTSLAWADDTIGGLTFSGDGRFSLVLDSEARGGGARLVDLASGDSRSIATQPPRSQSLGGLAEVSADATVMATRLYLSADVNDTAIGIWDLTQLQMVGQIVWPNATAGWPALSSKGGLLYGPQYSSEPGQDTTYSYDCLKVQSLADPSDTKTWYGLGSFAVALASDERTLAVATSRGAEWVIQLYDLLLGASAGELSIGDRVPASLHFSPDGTRLLVSRRDGWYAGASAPSKGVSVWRMGDGRLLWEGAGRTSRIQDAAFSPDGSTLVLVGNGLVDGLAGTLDSPGVEVYDARDGTWLRTLDTIYTSRGSVRFSTDGRYLMVPTYRGGIEIWRTADWQRYETFGYPWTEDAVFLPNNRGVLEISTGVIWCES